MALYENRHREPHQGFTRISLGKPRLYIAQRTSGRSYLFFWGKHLLFTLDSPTTKSLTVDKENE